MDLTKEQWKVIEPLLPKPKLREDGRGRPWRDPHDVLNGILWVLRTGAPWADLPARYPPYQALVNRLLDLLFPELPGLFSTLDGAAIRALLDRAPTPCEVKALGLESLKSLLSGASRGRVGKKKAEVLLRAAENSIAYKQGNTALRLELKLLLPRLNDLVAMRKQVEKRMAETLDRIDYAKRLLAIPGLGQMNKRSNIKDEKWICGVANGVGMSVE